MNPTFKKHQLHPLHEQNKAADGITYTLQKKRRIIMKTKIPICRKNKGKRIGLQER